MEDSNLPEKISQREILDHNKHVLNSQVFGRRDAEQSPAPPQQQPAEEEGTE